VKGGGGGQCSQSFNQNSGLQFSVFPVSVDIVLTILSHITMATAPTKRVLEAPVDTMNPPSKKWFQAEEVDDNDQAKPVVTDSLTWMWQDKLEKEREREGQ
jgi:hypothetical protein